MTSADDFWPTLEALGEDDVRKRLAEGVYGQQKRPLVEAWLTMKETAHGEAVAGQKDIREEKALQLSAEANSIARSSRTVAWCAFVISALMLLIYLVIETRK